MFRQKVRGSVVVHGIERPWGPLPMPDGSFLVSVRSAGQLVAVRNGALNLIPRSGLPAMRVQHTHLRHKRRGCARDPLLPSVPARDNRCSSG